MIRDCFERAIEEMVREDLAVGRIACAEVLVGDRDGVKFHRQFPGEGETMKIAPDSLFRMASMTKPVVGVCVMKQVERGLLSLDDEIYHYLPMMKDPMVGEFSAEFELTGTHPSPRQITVRDLLTHTSGLGSGMWFFTRCDKASIRDGMRLEDMMPEYAETPLEFDPGTAFSYSPLAGFDVLARLVEITSGLSIESFARKYVFDPLGMQDTTFAPTPEQMARVVRIHAEQHGKAVPVNMPPTVFESIPATYFTGGGGLISGGVDYAQFARMLLREGECDGAHILLPETVRLMRTAQLDPAVVRGIDETQSWGLSMRVITADNGSGKPLDKGAYGWSGAYGTHFWVDPVRDLFAVYLSNMTTAGGAGAITARRIEAVVMDEFARA